MSNVYGGDEVNALVLDVGSHSARAGYAGDDAPKAVFPSHVGIGGPDLPKPVFKNQAAMDVDGDVAAKPPTPSRATGGKKIRVGQNGVNFRRDDMEIASPFPALEDGVADWDILEAIWDHALRDRLRVDPSEYALLLAEQNAVPRAVREKAVELLFERFKVPALFMAKNAVLSAFATARQTALVVDAGYRYTSVTAVHDGYVLNKSVTTNPIGGRVLTTLMQQALESKAIRVLPRYLFKRLETSPGEFKLEELSFPKTHPSFHSYQMEQVVADVKEATSRVNELPYDDRVKDGTPGQVYELPDGTEILVGSERMQVPEVLFQPRLLGSFEGFNPDTLRRADGSLPTSLDTTILESVNKCDVDVRRELYSGVMLTGGVSLTPGLRDRLEKALTEAGPQAGKFKVAMPAQPIERKQGVWIGGSILASLGSFQQMWMSRKEFEEYGASLIMQRAP